MRLSFVIPCLVSCLGLAPSNALAETTGSVELPADFPTGLATFVAGELKAEPMPGKTLKLSHPKLDDQEVFGQCDESGKRVWIALTATKKMIGEPICLSAVEAEVAGSAVRTNRVTRKGSGEAYAFSVRNRVTLFYQSEPLTRHGHSRAGFVHPLYGLDGGALTEIFPADHRHHQGVFWAWHQLWVGDRKIGDPWVTKDHLVVVEGASETNRGPLFTELVVNAHWESPLLKAEDDVPLPIVAEQTTIRLYRANNDTQYVDFTIQLTPLLPDVKIGGSEDVKGYSGFTVRVKPPKDMVIEDAQGVREQDAVQTASPWADVWGSFAEGKTSGVGILSHPSLAQFPPRWLLRHYGMQNVAYPGREPVALSTDKPLVIRHRLVLHRGNTEQARIADHQRVYELTP